MRTRSLCLLSALALASACTPGGPGTTGGGTGTGGGSSTGAGGGSSTGAGGGSGTGAGGGSGTGAGGGSASTGPWTLVPAASPLTVSPTAEAAASVSQDVPLTGGVLTTTSADGTVFQLTIPGDALLSPQTIVMRPVQLAENPFGPGKTWGVELLPDGLSFNAPLTLVITPPAGQAPPVGQQVAFGWDGPQHQLALAHADPADARMVLKLLHFSSYAYATATRGTSASLAGVRARIGGSAEARLQSAVGERLAATRQAQLLGSTEDGLITAAELQALIEQYVREVVNPRVAAAGTSCAAGRLALETVLGTERQAQLLGMMGLVPQAQNLEALMDTVTSVCLDEEWGLCRDDHIIQRIIPVYFSVERQSQLLGIDTSGKAWEAKAAQYIQACHKYRLDVDTTVDNSSEFWSVTEVMGGQVPLKLSSSNLLVASIVSEEPHGPLRSLSYRIGYTNPCERPANVVQHDASLPVQSLTWDLKTDPLQPGKGEIDRFKLIYFPNLYQNSVFGTTHDILDACGMPPAPPETITGLNYWPVYLVVIGQLPAYFNLVDGFVFMDWTVYNNGGAVLARKSLDEQFVDGTIHYRVRSQLVLNHTPGL